MISTTSAMVACCANLYSPCLEVAARLERDDTAEEHPGLVDHALVLEQVGDRARADAARNVDHLVLGERAGRVETLLADEHGQRRARWSPAPAW